MTIIEQSLGKKEPPVMKTIVSIMLPIIMGIVGFVVSTLGTTIHIINYGFNAMFWCFHLPVLILCGILWTLIVKMQIKRRKMQK